MKKLMFAVAAMAAGVAMAAGEITSQNIVGYASNDLDMNYGAVMYAPQFLNVGGEGITLNNLTPKSESTIDDYTIYIQCLDNCGMVIEGQEYAWVGGQWTDSEGAPIDAKSITFVPGQGLYVLCFMGETPTSLQSSGEVNQKDVVVALDTNYGAVSTGNPFPTPIALADITPESDGTIDDYSIYIQCLDNCGMVIEGQEYTWVGSQWTDSEGTPVEAESIKFAPGQGLYVLCFMGETQSYLRFAAPEL